MNEPIWAASEAMVRALELLAQFDREPDVLSPDEQALCIAIRTMESFNEDKYRYFVKQVIDEFVKKNAASPPVDKPA